MRRMLLAALLLALVSTVRCTQVAQEPLQIERGMLTVDNRTSHEWLKVEVWVNQYFRVTAPALAAGGRLQVPLNSFVSGYAQRFDTKRLAVRGRAGYGDATGWHASEARPGFFEERARSDRRPGIQGRK